MEKPRVAVHKFASCDGCQLALLNAGEALLALATRVRFVHFAEAGIVDPEAEADIALVEGSITTAHDATRICDVRARSRYLVSLGACATAGGIQALRNGRMRQGDWLAAVYARPEMLDALDTSTPIAEHVKVDLELPGCPVSPRQVMAALADLLLGVRPRREPDSVCLECKRAGQICVLVAKGEPCLGPVTHGGCGALCPAHQRACYGCFGPAEQVNGAALVARFQELGLRAEEARQRFLFIAAGAQAFRRAAGEDHDATP
ncbi:sulfhydrogenase subunit delta [Thiobacter aerophilum]|uniref:Sulfhydrogenase subunit delta n=1 Tax=Thiobacter aerophilum TaxID=3121275 RepID=A0ABV0EDB0_9BURK